MENNIEYEVIIKMVYPIPFDICNNEEEAIDEAAQLFAEDLSVLGLDDFIYEVNKLYNSKLEARIDEVTENK